MATSNLDLTQYPLYYQHLVIYSVDDGLFYLNELHFTERERTESLILWIRANHEWLTRESSRTADTVEGLPGIVAVYEASGSEAEYPIELHREVESWAATRGIRIGFSAVAIPEPKPGFLVSLTPSEVPADLPDHFAPKPTASGLIDPPADPLKLWRFHWDCGRQGDVESVFVATQAEIDGAVGTEIYFGEILGKHSEVYGTIEKGDLTLISEDTQLVDIFAKHVGSTGHNPLDYLEVEE